MIRQLSDLRSLLAGRQRPVKLVLAAAQDEHALDAVIRAAGEGIIEPVLIGDRPLILKAAADHHLSAQSFEMLDAPDVQAAVEAAVRLVHDGNADILMKGACSTSQLLKGVLNRDWGLRKGDLLSHFALFELPTYHKLLAVTDVAINIAPGREDKLAIAQNAVEYLNLMGIGCPKVAAIAAVETVNEQMPATLDAVWLAGECRAGRAGSCLIEGPMALDAAISRESALHKNMASEVAGEVDLLLMPDIEAGNVLYKALANLAGGKVAAVVLGASAPVVLTSRSDSEETKLNSILLAAAVNPNGNPNF